jgi:purine-nucleoside phosphorylase
VYCAGEDRRELLQALAEVVAPEVQREARDYLGSPIAGTTAYDPHWLYRSYEFWRFRNFSLVLSGIGTGCLEPLLYELLRPGIVRKIVLVGTAGMMPSGKAALDEACAIDQAWPAATGIDAEVAQPPLAPRWELSQDERTASAVSTDFYYGFAPAILEGNYPAGQGPLKALFDEHLRRGTDLVDMEVAQFYFFCGAYGDPALQYLAVKAAANAVGRGEQQMIHTGAALRNCLGTALRLLGIAR